MSLHSTPGGSGLGGVPPVTAKFQGAFFSPEKAHVSWQELGSWPAHDSSISRNRTMSSVIAAVTRRSRVGFRAAPLSDVVEVNLGTASAPMIAAASSAVATSTAASHVGSTVSRASTPGVQRHVPAVHAPRPVVSSEPT